MKNKKMYSYSTVICGAVIFGILLSVVLVLLILFPAKAWFLIIPLFVLLLIGWYAIAMGIFYPICLSETGIVYRSRKYGWDDIKITAYSILHRSQIEGYILLFGENYFSLKEIKTERRKGFYVYLKEKSLFEILKYYKNKILILDGNGIEDKIHSTKKINFTINEHNKSY